MEGIPVGRTVCGTLMPHMVKPITTHVHCVHVVVASDRTHCILGIYPKYNIHSPHCCRKALNHDWPLLPCRIDTQQVAQEIQLANLWLDMCSMNIFMIARSVFEKREILINQWRFDPCDGTRASVDRPNKQYYPQTQHTFPVYIARVLCSSSQK